MASYLMALSRAINKLFKYSDNTTFLVPERTDVSLEDKFRALKQWAENNKMILNLLKTKEVVFHRPDPRLYIQSVDLYAVMGSLETLSRLETVFSLSWSWSWS